MISTRANEKLKRLHSFDWSISCVQTFLRCVNQHHEDSYFLTGKPTSVQHVNAHPSVAYEPSLSDGRRNFHHTHPIKLAGRTNSSISSPDLRHQRPCLTSRTRREFHFLVFEIEHLLL
jgi:hypothetical protein